MVNQWVTVQARENKGNYKTPRSRRGRHHTSKRGTSKTGRVKKGKKQKPSVRGLRPGRKAQWVDRFHGHENKRRSLPIPKPNAGSLGEGVKNSPKKKVGKISINGNRTKKHKRISAPRKKKEKQFFQKRGGRKNRLKKKKKKQKKDQKETLGRA